MVQDRVTVEHFQVRCYWNKLAHTCHSTFVSYNCGTSPFAIEFWLYLAQSTTGQGILGTRYLSHNKTHGRFIQQHTCRWFNFPNQIGKVYLQNGDTFAQDLISANFSLITWRSHCDSSNVYRIFTNGVQQERGQLILQIINTLLDARILI